MILGIIVAHKNAAESVLGALTGMYGPVEHLVSISNEGLSANELAERIREADGTGREGVCIFTDTFGGSPWRAAKMARLTGSVIITGFNLPMLLSFVNKRNTVPFSDLPSVLEKDGKRGIVVERA